MLRHSWEPFLFGVSLDACAVAGNTFTSFSPSFFSPPPLPSPTSRVAYLQANQAFATGFSMRFGLSSVCPRSFGFPFIPPTDAFPFFFHVLLSSRLFILILSFSCAHYRPDLSLYTYTHAYSLTTRFRWPRFVTMRFGSSVVPLHLVLLHRQPRTLFVGLVLFMFICHFCVHMCLASFPGRMEATHASLRGGVCV